MPKQGGSLWRWRTALLLVTVVAISLGWWAKESLGSRRVLSMDQAGTTIVVERRRQNVEHLDAIDIATGRQRTIWRDDPARSGYQAVSANGGRSIAILRQGLLTVVDVVAPSARREYSLTTEHGRLVGVTSDERYLVLHRSYFGSTPTAVEVVDLASGNATDHIETQSYTIRTPDDDLFASHCNFVGPAVTDPPHAFWRVSHEGKWVRVADPQPTRLYRGQTQLLVVSPDGRRRWATPTETDAQQGRSVPVEVQCASGDGSLAVLMDTRWQRPFDREFWFVDGRGDIVHVGRTPDYGSCYRAITYDGRYCAVQDAYDTIQVLDCRSQETVFLDRGPLWTRRGFGALAAVGAICVALWWMLADREPSPSLAVCDIAMAAITWQLACLSALVWRRPAISDSIFADDPGFPYAIVATCGALFACPVLVGWFWAQAGIGFLVRWIIGWIVIVLAMAPSWSWHYAFEVSLPMRAANTLVLPCVLLFVAGVVAIVATAPMAFAWRLVPDVKSAADPRRFGLADLMVVTLGVGCLAAFVRVLLADASFVRSGDVQSLGAAALIVGTVAPGVTFSRWPSWRVATLLIALIVAGLATIALNWAPIFPRSRLTGVDANGVTHDMLGAVALLTQILVPLWIWRRKGWRWRRFGGRATPPTMEQTP